jgi:hypothetical protein
MQRQRSRNTDQRRYCFQPLPNQDRSRKAFPTDSSLQCKGIDPGRHFQKNNEARHFKQIPAAQRQKNNSSTVVVES